MFVKIRMHVIVLEQSGAEFCGTEDDTVSASQGETRGDGLPAERLIATSVMHARSGSGLY